MNFDLLRIILIIIVPFALLGGGIELLRNGYEVYGYIVIGIGSIGMLGLLWVYSWLRNFKM